MSTFEPVTLRWRDRDYTIQSDAVMEAIARVEQFVTLEDVHAAMGGRGIKRVQLSRAFASVLRYAGASKVTDEEVYEGMFKAGDGNAVISSVLVLMAMMVPPSALVDKVLDGNPKLKNPNRRARRAARSSSSQPIRRQLSAGESRPETSGE